MKRNIIKDLFYSRQCRLWVSLPVGYTEIPIRDLMTTPPPLIGPGEYVHAGAALTEYDLRLPGECVGLCFLSVSQAVQTYFCKHQRKIAA